jgi:hypothetical protein
MGHTAKIVKFFAKSLFVMWDNCENNSPHFCRSAARSVKLFIHPPAKIVKVFAKSLAVMSGRLWPKYLPNFYRSSREKSKIFTAYVDEIVKAFATWLLVMAVKFWKILQAHVVSAKILQRCPHLCNFAHIFSLFTHFLSYVLFRVYRPCHMPQCRFPSTRLIAAQLLCHNRNLSKTECICFGMLKISL